MAFTKRNSYFRCQTIKLFMLFINKTFLYFITFFILFKYTNIYYLSIIQKIVN